MRHTKSEVYVHLVWATWDRLPLITPGLKPDLLACIRKECQRLGCETLALEAVADHVHLLVSLPLTIAVSDMVKQVKGSSSHLANRVLVAGSVFKWQGAYAAFSVSKNDLPALRTYVANQESHHRCGSTVVSLEFVDGGLASD
jgi:putative transposase